MTIQRRGTGFWLAPLAVSAAVIAGDRVSKLAIRHSVGVEDSIPVISDWLRIIHTENPGGAFGVLADGNVFVRAAVLIGVAAAVLLFVTWALLGKNSAFEAVRTRLALALILGGAVGNLYDRVMRGTVTDFIEVFHGAWSFPAFNVADSAITVGAILLIADLIWPPRKKQTSERVGEARA